MPSPGRRHRRVPDFDVQARLDGFVGGASAPWTNGLVRLDIYQSGLQWGPSKPWIRRLVPVWQARIDEVQVVEVVGRKAIRIRTADGSYRVFGCWSAQDRDATVSALVRHGYPVDQVPQKLHYLFPGL